MKDDRFEPLITRSYTYEKWVFRDEDGEIVTSDFHKPSDRLIELASFDGITLKLETFTHYYQSID